MLCGLTFLQRPSQLHFSSLNQRIQGGASILTNGNIHLQPSQEEGGDLSELGRGIQVCYIQFTSDMQGIMWGEPELTTSHCCSLRLRCRKTSCVLVVAWLVSFQQCAGLSCIV